MKPAIGMHLKNEKSVNIVLVYKHWDYNADKQYKVCTNDSSFWVNTMSAKTNPFTEINVEIAKISK